MIDKTFFLYTSFFFFQFEKKGVVLHSLTLQSTDINGEVRFVVRDSTTEHSDPTSQLIYKQITLQNFAVYWNSDESNLDQVNTSTVSAFMGCMSSIFPKERSTSLSSTCQYILQPVNGRLNAIINDRGVVCPINDATFRERVSRRLGSHWIQNTIQSMGIETEVDRSHDHSLTTRLLDRWLSLRTSTHVGGKSVSIHKSPELFVFEQECRGFFADYSSTGATALIRTFHEACEFINGGEMPPPVLLSAQFEQIAIQIAQPQFRDALSVVEYFSIIQKKMLHASIRPTVPVIGHEKEWWHFAITAVRKTVKENIKRQ